jgi:hypothetical protein
VTGAVGIDRAIPVSAAATTAAQAAAVRIGLQRVLVMVDAAIGDARASQNVADVRGAIGVLVAALALCAFGSAGPAAVDVGLVAIALMVGALLCDTSERHAVAGVRRAITIDEALQTERAGWANAATICVGASGGNALARARAGEPGRTVRALEALHALTRAVAHRAIHGAAHGPLRERLHAGSA